MTVTSELSRVTYSGNGSTTLFTVPFYFITAADLRVVLRAVDGTETAQALTTNYSVTGAGVQSGGSITLTAAPASGTVLVIYRDPPNTQTADYVAGGRFPAESHERALDRIVMSVQRTRELAARTINLAETDTDGSGAFQARGNRIANLGAPVASTDAATKAYVDAQAVAGFAALVSLLPTSLPATAGQLWNNGGILSIS